MIRHARPDDHLQILRLYRAVAEVPDGIARTPGEVTEAYISGCMERARDGGIELVWEEEGRICGEIHAARGGPASIAHLLTDLTIAVAPDCHRRGIGRALFQGLLDEVMANMPHITRVELFARTSNTRARALYQSLGFVDEGRLRARVRNSRGELEDDTFMGWTRP